MAKFTLKAGAEIDLASPDELHAETDRLIRELKRIDITPTVELTSAGFSADASGNVGGGLNGNGQVLYTCPMGRAAKIHRIGIKAAGFTPAAPLNQGWMEFHANAPGLTGLLLFTPAAGNVTAPLVFVEGQHDAIMLRTGDALIVIGAGFPANQQFGFRLQVQLLDHVQTVSI